MAENAVGLVLKGLGDFLAKEARLAAQVREQMESMGRKLEWIMAFLKDADHQRTQQQNATMRVWVNQVREVAYDIEDIIDDCSLSTQLQQLWRVDFTRWMRSLVAFVSQICTNRDLQKRMVDIHRRLDEITVNRSSFNVGTNVSSLSSSSMALTRRYKLVDDPVGFVEDAYALTQRLIDQNVKRRAVISIVGMGGSGKSTLAKKLYNSQIVKAHFNCRAWTVVSQAYKAEEILKQILKDVSGIKEEELKNINELQATEMLKEHMRGKRYLVVIDDIWDKAAWDSIEVAFRDEKMGSRILLTTRFKDVASYADNRSPLHELRLFRPEESWELFTKSIFAGASCPSHLETLKGEIIEKCDGLPLAIVALAGILRTKDESFHEWRGVLETISTIFKGEDRTHSILALSYYVLPYNLKSCFLYFAAFPEDSLIDAQTLTRLWVAEGFVPQLKDRTMERSAEDFLKELINRSMVLLEGRGIKGRVRRVHVHDLFLEFARAEAAEINFFQIHDSGGHPPPDPSKLRRLFLNHGGVIGSPSGQQYSAPKLRSLLCGEYLKITRIPNFIFHGSKLLRVIDLEDANISILPKEIGDILQLRYLGLRSNFLTELPSSIGNLSNLQTLDITGTTIRTVADAFWKIRTLRHVLLPFPIEDDRHFRTNMETSGSFDDLQTLMYIRSGDCVRKGVLRKMRNLRTLGITHIDDSDQAEALFDALQKLEFLEELELRGRWLPGVSMFSYLPRLQFMYLEGPTRMHPPHPTSKTHPLSLSLTYLYLDDCRLVQEDITMLATQLPNLQHLELYYEAYVSRRMACPSRGFPRLRYLELSRIPDLEEWIVEDGALPALAELVIYSCAKLTMLPEGLHQLAALEQLRLILMPMIARRILKDVGEDYPKIKHVPSITITYRDPPSVEEGQSSLDEENEIVSEDPYEKTSSC